MAPTTFGTFRRFSRTHHRDGSRQQRASFFRPQVEALEDRTVPSAIRNIPGFTANVLPANDDGSTGIVPLGFTINLFGLQESACFVNNNGNITFNAALSQFTPDDLTTPGHPPIIAPFFADVDTRGAGSGLVTYGQGIVDGRLAFGVNYFNVGYFASHVDKLNTFQLILIQGCDTGPGDFDIEFNFQQIQWETGDASGGSGGLGGSSAHVGFTNGSGVPGTFFEVPGSGVNGAFLDSNFATGLSHTSLNSSVVGRYEFFARGGNIFTQPQDLLVHYVVTGAQTGSSEVRVFNGDTNQLTFDFQAFPGFTGGVNVATGDVNGDRIPDIIVGAGPGGGPHVEVFSGADLHLLLSFFAYAPTFLGGVSVGVGDLNGDDVPDIVTGAGPGGGPHVRAFNGATGNVFMNFFAFDKFFTGGVSVAVGDIGTVGESSIAVGAGPGGGPHVRLFQPNGQQDPGPLGSFFAYSPDFLGGVNVSVGHFASGGCFNLITSPASAGRPHIEIFDSFSGQAIRSFFAAPPFFFQGDEQPADTGTHVAAIQRSGAPVADILVAFGPTHEPNVSVFDFATLQLIDTFFAFDPGFLNGLTIAALELEHRELNFCAIGAKSSFCSPPPSGSTDDTSR